MLEPIYVKKFNKDFERISKQGKNLEKLKSIMRNLSNEIPLEKRFLDHKLRGKYTDCRECHIEPDLLLIYMINPPYIKFLRTGSHSELFK